MMHVCMMYVSILLPLCVCVCVRVRRQSWVWVLIFHHIWSSVWHSAPRDRVTSLQTSRLSLASVSPLAIELLELQMYWLAWLLCVFCRSELRFSYLYSKYFTPSHLLSAYIRVLRFIHPCDPCLVFTARVQSLSPIFPHWYYYLKNF